MSDFFSSNLLKNDLVAAPLAGYSHMPYRRILREFFDGIIYSEMISVEGLSRRNKETMEYLDRKEYESPLVFQLFGGRPESYTPPLLCLCPELAWFCWSVCVAGSALKSCVVS